MKRSSVYTLLILFASALGNPLCSQSNHMLQTQAYQAMYEKDWFGASQYYNRLYHRDSTKISLTYHFAEASRLNFEIDQALHLYKRVVISNTKKYPLAYYWVGQLYKNKSEYKEAGKWFTKFSKLNLKGNYGYYKERAKEEVEACELAQIALSSTSGVVVQHLDTAINSQLSEYAPVENRHALYFSSVKKSKNAVENENPLGKIYKTEFKNNKWEKIKALDTALNSTYLHNANTCFSEDNKQMIVSRCRNKNAAEYACELYLSHFVNNKWQPAVRMEDTINRPGSSTTQPCFGKLGNKTVLFFSSNRSGGEGGMDIWYAPRQEDGSFDPPVNAGKQVNTVDDEITPWFDNTKQSLYFSSTYHRGYGAFDIFKSAYSGNDFTTAQNLGYPVNSGYNDIYFSLNQEGKRAYLSSNRVGSNFEKKLNCCNDIYAFDIPDEYHAPTIDSTALTREKLKLLVPLTLYFHNDEPEPKTEGITTTKNYASTYMEYKALYLTYKKEFKEDLSRNLKDKASYLVESFFTDSLEGGYDALAKFTELLKDLMKKGETVTIILKGYCSPLASTNYNKKLARRRISSLRNYFNDAGNGVLRTYVDNKNPGEGKLIFVEEDIGELPTSRVSDDFKDKQHSVYSPHAAYERKIQIIAVSFGK